MSNEYNISVSLLLPLTYFPQRYSGCLVNTYIYDKYKHGNKLGVYVLIHNNAEVEKLLRIIQTFSVFEDSYTLPEHIMMSFKLLPIVEDCLKLFVKGKYTHFPDSAKRIIKEYYKTTGRSNEDKILEPTLEERQNLADRLGIKLSAVKELCSKPSIEEETFRIEKLMPLTQTDEL